MIETPPSRPLHLKAHVIAQCQESLVRRRLGAVFVRWGKSANGSPPRRRTVLTVLRHSYITHLIEFGYPERFAQDQAGHAYASTTAIYTGVSDEFRNRLLAKALRARHAGMWEDQP